MPLFLIILLAYVATMLYLNAKVEPANKRIPEHLESTRKALSPSPPKAFFHMILIVLAGQIAFRAIRSLLEWLGYSGDFLSK
jgi:hypothetical protein